MVDPALLITRRTVIESFLAGIIGQIPQWGYDGASDPSHWAELSADYHTCGDGKQQSPIDLDITKTDKASVTFDYRPVAISLLNNGRTVQQTGSQRCTLTINDQVYQLLQFHIHTPSEHTQNTVHYPMELHFVHRHLKTGELVVVGVWLKPGAAQPELEALTQHLPQRPGEQIRDSIQLNPANLLPKNSHLVSYSGSLTTPPCSEGVTWLVMTEPIEASARQIDTFHRLLGNNARPLQRLEP